MARVVFKRWDAERLLQQVPARIVREYGEAVAPQLQKSIGAVRYFWFNDTIRKVSRGGLGIRLPESEGGGVLVKGRRNRDIIDTGWLQDSQSSPAVAIGAGRVTMRIVWSADYSRKVLLGEKYINRDGEEVEMPGRDWISPVLAQNPPGRYFVARWRQIAAGG